MTPRLRRLENDFAEMVERFAQDPYVDVIPVGPAPAQQYQIVYKVPSLRRLLNNELREVPQTVVNLFLPAGYPREKPYAETVEEVFHPNFGRYICIADFWSPAQSLSDIVVLIGEMLQWKKFNIRSPLNAIAAEWSVEHPQEIPLSNIEIGVKQINVEVQLVGEISNFTEQ